MIHAAVVDPALDLAAQRTWCQRLMATDGVAELLLFAAPVESSDRPESRQRVEPFDGMNCTVIADVTAAQLPGRANAEGVDLLLVFYGPDHPHVELRRQILEGFGGLVLGLRLGEHVGHDPLRILVPMRGEPGAAAALRLAEKLAGEEGAVTAAFVEPDIGLDADAVGARELDRILRRAAGGGSSISDRVHREVVIAASVPDGVAALYERGQYELVLTGASPQSALGRRLKKSIVARIAGALPAATVGHVRAAVPISGRLQRWVEIQVLRTVPQLEREQRVALVEKVQSNSRWDFDFFALMASSTVIAAIGLVMNSEAVVIGAMLVAPLMTPLLGTGLSIVHGNPQLARNALRSIALGFLVAFSIGVVTGWFALDVDAPVPSAMLARGWPGVLDLLVAFVAGLAGAYATSRASLMAALPGVAIAAALVPPIATAGLAVSVGLTALSIGAALLFVTNMVAIVLAASICLWSVGLREFKPRSKLHMFIGVVAMTVALGVGLWLSADSPRKETAVALRQAIEQISGGDGMTVEDIEIRNVATPRVVIVHLVGGDAPPSEEFVDKLRAALEAEIRAKVDLRTRWVWERRSPR